MNLPYTGRTQAPRFDAVAEVDDDWATPASEHTVELQRRQDFRHRAFPQQQIGAVARLDEAARLATPHYNPRIDTLAVVISVGHRISVRPFATAIFCVPLTE